MSVTDQLLENNEKYAAGFEGPLPLPPARHVAVLACMDARLDVHDLLGLEEGDAHVIRNAGGVASDDAIRSLAISQRLLGTREIVLIHHTDCGMLTFTDDEFKAGDPEGDRPQARLVGGGVRRRERRRPSVDRPDHGQPLHPAPRPGAGLRLRRGDRTPRGGLRLAGNASGPAISYVAGPRSLDPATR